MDLTAYDIILVNSSSGKDSQAMLDVVCEMAMQQKVMDRVVVVHCDLGRCEWAGTRELAQQHAEFYGVRFEVIKRPQGDLLDHVKERRLWPSSKQRYCTSDHKRGQVSVVMTKLVDELREKTPRQIRVLSCMGHRAEESPARAKKIPFQLDKRNSNGKRQVDIWLPLHTWKLGEVWARNAAAGTEAHWAYKIGMTRLSCVFCIFAPRNALLIAGEHNPELLKEYVKVEKEIGHQFRQNQPIAEIQEALARGERGKPCQDGGCWNM